MVNASPIEVKDTVKDPLTEDIQSVDMDVAASKPANGTGRDFLRTLAADHLDGENKPDIAAIETAAKDRYGLDPSKLRSGLKNTPLGTDSAAVLKSLEAAKADGATADQANNLKEYVESDFLPDMQKKGAEVSAKTQQALKTSTEKFQDELNKIIAERNKVEGQEGKISRQDIVRALYRAAGGNHSKFDRQAFKLADELGLDMKALLSRKGREELVDTDKILAQMLKKN